MTWRMRAVGMALALVVVLPAQAGLEPVVGECNGSTCLWHEPTVHAPKGWEFKESASSRYHARAFAPTGSNFANATAVMYAKAVPKEGQPATLAGFISQDVASYQARDAKLKVKTGLAYPDGDGRRLQAVQLVPSTGTGQQWQTIAYGEEGAFYLVFDLSASGVVEHDAAVPAFEQMVASYHVGMPAAPNH